MQQDVSTLVGNGLDSSIPRYHASGLPEPDARELNLCAVARIPRTPLDQSVREARPAACDALLNMLGWLNVPTFRDGVNITSIASRRKRLPAAELPDRFV